MSRHQFGERGGLNTVMDIQAGKSLPTLEISKDVCLGGDG